jgi:hypothetical protein
MRRNHRPVSFPIFIEMCNGGWLVSGSRKLCPYEHLWRTQPVDLEIHEVTTGVSLSTKTSPIAESIASLNPRINLSVPSRGFEPWLVDSNTRNLTNWSMITSLIQQLFGLYTNLRHKLLDLHVRTPWGKLHMLGWSPTKMAQRPLRSWLAPWSGAFSHTPG